MGAITQSLGLFGATGELGRAFFDGLEEQPAFVGRLRLFASERSQEETRLFRDKPLAVEVADQADFLLLLIGGRVFAEELLVEFLVFDVFLFGFFDLRKQFQQTFLIVTHNEELAELSDRILHMKDGKIV